MLAAEDLHVDVLVVVLVQGGHGARVADPEVDGVGLLLQGNACPGYVALDVAEERGVLVPQVVVLRLGVSDFRCLRRARLLLLDDVV